MARTLADLGRALDTEVCPLGEEPDDPVPPGHRHSGPRLRPRPHRRLVPRRRRRPGPRHPGHRPGTGPPHTPLSHARWPRRVRDAPRQGAGNRATSPHRARSQRTAHPAGASRRNDRRHPKPPGLRRPRHENPAQRGNPLLHPDQTVATARKPHRRTPTTAPAAARSPPASRSPPPRCASRTCVFAPAACLWTFVNASCTTRYAVCSTSAPYDRTSPSTDRATDHPRRRRLPDQLLQLGQTRPVPRTLTTLGSTRSSHRRGHPHRRQRHTLHPPLQPRPPTAAPRASPATRSTPAAPCPPPERRSAQPSPDPSGPPPATPPHAPPSDSPGAPPRHASPGRSASAPRSAPTPPAPRPAPPAADSSRSRLSARSRRLSISRRRAPTYSPSSNGGAVSPSDVVIATTRNQPVPDLQTPVRHVLVRPHERHDERPHHRHPRQRPDDPPRHLGGGERVQPDDAHQKPICGRRRPRWTPARRRSATAAATPAPTRRQARTRSPPPPGSPRPRRTGPPPPRTPPADSTARPTSSAALRHRAHHQRPGQGRGVVFPRSGHASSLRAPRPRFSGEFRRLAYTTRAAGPQSNRSETHQNPSNC